MKAVCDRECALINRCQVGGVRCAGCGSAFCATDLNEYGLCENCETIIEAEETEEEV